MQKVQFFFDFLSPFSYFAFNHHREFFSKYPQLELVYRPVLMGKLFSHFEFPGPGQILVKRNYELKKCFRYAHQNQIKFHPPSNFPFNPLGIIRMATKHAGGKDQFQIIKTIFELVWGQGQILEDPDLVKEFFIKEKINTECIDRSFEKTAKIELKNNIQEAIALNIFGVPSFALDKEFFWGNDCWQDLGNYLSGNDIYAKELYNSLISQS